MGKDLLNGMTGKPNTKSYYMGEAADIGNGVKFIVNSVHDTNKIGYNRTDKNYIIVTYTIINESKKPWYQNPNDITLLLNDIAFEYSSATYSLENSASGSNAIDPGLSKEFNIAFETTNKSNEKNYIINFSALVNHRKSNVSIFLCESPG